MTPERFIGLVSHNWPTPSGSPCCTLEKENCLADRGVPPDPTVYIRALLVHVLVFGVWYFVLFFGTVGGVCAFFFFKCYSTCIFLSLRQESGVADYMGMFAVACMGCDEMVKHYEGLNDDYSKIMVQVLYFLLCGFWYRQCVIVSMSG